MVIFLGPVSRDVDTLKQLIDAGMNIARMNFSHGSHEVGQQCQPTFNKSNNCY